MTIDSKFVLNEFKAIEHHALKSFEFFFPLFSFRQYRLRVVCVFV